MLELYYNGKVIIRISFQYVFSFEKTDKWNVIHTYIVIFIVWSYVLNATSMVKDGLDKNKINSGEMLTKEDNSCHFL